MSCLLLSLEILSLISNVHSNEIENSNALIMFCKLAHGEQHFMLVVKHYTPACLLLSCSHAYKHLLSTYVDVYWAWCYS